jgi:hypothetical protein
VWIYKGDILPAPKETEEEMLPIEVTVKADAEPEEGLDATAEEN